MAMGASEKCELRFNEVFRDGVPHEKEKARSGKRQDDFLDGISRCWHLVVGTRPLLIDRGL